MTTKKNRINILIIITVILSIFTFLIIAGIIAFPFYFGMNYPDSNESREIQTKLNGNIISKISDSLYTVKWKYNLPANKKKQLYSFLQQGGYCYYFEKKDTLNIFWSKQLQNGGYLSGEKEEVTETIIIGLDCYNIIFIDAIYTDSSRIFYDNLSDEKKDEYEKLLSQTVFKDIEKEAKKQNLPDSIIYLPKETLEKYGYYEFAKKIYPEKK